MSVAIRTITTPDGMQLDYRVIVCDGEECSKATDHAGLHAPRAGWRAVLGYYSMTDGDHNMQEHHYCSKKCLTGHLEKLPEHPNQEDVKP